MFVLCGEGLACGEQDTAVNFDEVYYAGGLICYESQLHIDAISHEISLVNLTNVAWSAKTEPKSLKARETY